MKNLVERIRADLDEWARIPKADILKLCDAIELLEEGVERVLLHDTKDLHPHLDGVSKQVKRLLK